MDGSELFWLCRRPSHGTRFRMGKTVWVFAPGYLGGHWAASLQSGAGGPNGDWRYCVEDGVWTQKAHRQRNLCMAGGVALNCVANARLRDAGLFRNIFVQPAAGDAGGSLGAALAAHYIYFGKQFNPRTKDAMKGTFRDRLFTNEETKQTLTEMGAVFTYFEDVDELCGIVAGRLGAIVGWCNGRMEFGPRALGNRSILCRSAQ